MWWRKSFSLILLGRIYVCEFKVKPGFQKLTFRVQFILKQTSLPGYPTEGSSCQATFCRSLSGMPQSSWSLYRNSINLIQASELVQSYQRPDYYFRASAIATAFSYGSSLSEHCYSAVCNPLSPWGTPPTSLLSGPAPSALWHKTQAHYGGSSLCKAGWTG